MKPNLKNYIFLFFFCFFSTVSISANYAQATKKLFVTVNIIVEDTTMLHNDSLEFTMCKNKINSHLGSVTDLYRLPLNSPKTKFIIPLTSSINYGRIACLDGKLATFRELNNDNDLFIFQAGDQIQLHLTNHIESAFFSGGNSEKYNCLYKINNNKSISVDKFNNYCKNKDFEKAYKSLMVQRDSLYTLQLSILNSYKRKLAPEIYNLIKLDIWSNCNHIVINYCYIAFALEYTEHYKAASDLFNKYYSNSGRLPANKTSLLVESYNYCDFLFDKEKDYAIIKNRNSKGKSFAQLTFADINNAINSHIPKGVIKDKVKLLSYFSLIRRRQSDFADFIEKDIREAGNNQFKSALIGFRNSNATGATAFPFELPDENGQIIRLEDLKGKVIVMDFWFTGCKGCVGMAEALKTILPIYKSNPKIVFVTVSSDRSKSMWANSLKKEIYTSQSEINLLAGMDLGSPIIKHYNIKEFPTLIIISKEGKILSAVPPDPRVNADKFKNFINNYL